MDACEDVVDTSDVEEREIIKTKQPDYYLKAWSKIKSPNITTQLQDNPGDDGMTSHLLAHPIPPTTPLFSGRTATFPIDLRDSISEDLASYSPNSSSLLENSRFSKVHQASAVPESIPNDEPNSSQDPICLFPFPSSFGNVTRRSRTPLTPLKGTFHSEIHTENCLSCSRIDQRSTEFWTGPAVEESEALQLKTPSTEFIPSHLGVGSPISTCGFVEKCTEPPETSPLHGRSEHGQCPSMISLDLPRDRRSLSRALSVDNVDLQRRKTTPSELGRRNSNLPHSIIPLDPDPPSRKYSLRDRSAKQLNPFEYDKRQYQRLLRHMPEAIVRRTLFGGSHKVHREDQDDDWVESQNIEEEETQVQEVHQNEKERREQRRQMDQLLRDLNLTVPSSDDDLDSISSELEKERNTTHPNDAQGSRGKKRKRTIRSFPLKITEISNGHNRPRDAPLITTPSLHRTQSCISPLPDASIDLDVHYGNGLHTPSLGISDPLGDPGTWATGVSPSVHSVHDSSDRESPRAGTKRLRRGPLSRNGSDIVVIDEPHLTRLASSSGSHSESPASSKHRMNAQERILRRFLPAGVVKKFLEQDKQINGKARARNDINRAADVDAARPGHGRKRIVSPGSLDPSRYQIKGDTESETNSSSPSGDIIDIDDGMLSGGEEDIELLEKDSEGSLQNDELHHWLTGDPTVHESGGGSMVEGAEHRASSLDTSREPELIDRMLQRTRRVGLVRSRKRHKHNGEQTKSRAPIRANMPVAYKPKPKKLYQTKLSFKHIRKPSIKPNSSRQHRLSPLNMHIPDFDIQFQQKIATTESLKKRRHRRVRPDKYQNVYFTRNDGFNITSGRSRPFIQINPNDEDFHDALAPETLPHKTQAFAVAHKPRTSELINQFRNATSIERDEFDPSGHGPSVQKISLDFNIQPILAGITLSREGYIGRGSLFELISFLRGSALASTVPSVSTLSNISFDPNKPIAEISMDLALVFDKLYNASALLSETSETTIGEMRHAALALYQLITHKIIYAEEDEANHTITILSEQTKHLLARIDERLEMVSADGHSLDFRTFDLYWLIVELHLRIAYARQRRSEFDGSSHLLNTHIAEEYIVQLLRRLLEYDTDRIMGPLQRDGLALDKNSPDMRVLEYWICALHISPFLSRPAASHGGSFWRLLEVALTLQSNKPESHLAQSERIWKTVFTVNAFNQFSIEGISKSLAKGDAYWPIINKVLQSIRLNADSKKDSSKPAATIQKRDAYLRLVTARCYILSSSWQWDANDAEEVFRELCSIFRSRDFGNLLGEPDDFPSFIRNRDEALCHTYSTADTAYAILLKLVIHTVRNLNTEERMRGTRITRLLSLIVPVGATSFSKTSPPLDNDLSRLYNRYTAIYVAIYVDPSEKHIRSRLQQVRRYVNFKLADPDSRMATIRAMMNIAILLRHLKKPLIDVHQWASAIIQDLLTEYGDSQVKSAVQNDLNHIILLIHTVLGTIRFIMDTPTLDRSAPVLAEYPDIAYLQVWMPQTLSSPLVKDHRTGLEICSCVQKFLSARATVIPLPAIPKPRLEESQESQDDYGEYDLDMNDPNLLALFDQAEPVNENHAADQHASEILDTFSSKFYSCVCMHLGCPRREIDAWLDSWLGFGKILVQNRKRQWEYYLKLAESAWEDIKDPFQRMYIRLRCMMTILKLDPHLYKTHANNFLRLGFEALVSPKITLEHEYYSLLLSVDSLSHVLLRQTPYTVDPTSGFFNLDKRSFLDKRPEFIAKIFHNASLDQGVLPSANIFGFVEVMLTALQYWKEEIFHDDQHHLKDEYAKFAEDTLALARSHDVLLQHLGPRLS